MIVLENYTVLEENVKARFVDYCIGIFPQLSTKNAVKKAIKRGELLHNAKPALTGTFIQKYDEIQLVDKELRQPKYFDVKIEVLYQDDYFAIVDKPSGLVVSGNQYQTLENALVDRLGKSDQKDALKWAKPVHRLDSATSGLIIMAKSMAAHRALAKLFQDKEIEKEYHAIVMGQPIKNAGILDFPIEGKESYSEFKQISVVDSLRSVRLSLIKLIPKTGRTHQLRIHCAQMGHPIVGDVLYGKKGETLLHKGLFLVATKLRFIHPMTHEEILIELPVPYKFKSFLNREQKRFNRYYDIGE